MKEQIEELYYVQNKTMNQIAEILGKSISTISRLFKKFNIDVKRRIKDLRNLEFNDWTVIDFGESCNNWLCKCKCGTTKLVASSHLRGGYSRKCKLCQNKEQIHDSNSLSLTYFNGIKSDAKRRKKNFLVTKDYLWSLFELQDRKCALSGIDIYFAEKVTDYSTASLDRIDSNIGYIEGNVQWVHRTVNKMKMDIPEEEFIEFCRQISSYQENNNV